MLYLASQSPRRSDLLKQVGLEFLSLKVDVPEVIAAGESAEAYVKRVAYDKAHAGWLLVRELSNARVLSADTEVVLNGQVLGKPRDRQDAAHMLLALQGKTHLVLSAVCVIDQFGWREDLSVSHVRMVSLNYEQIQTYLDSEEYSGKAGGYAIQGRAAAFIDHLSGSYSGVMGLPLFETLRLLRTE
jgi:septum formation protein